jgi:hypothetical protein
VVDSDVVLVREGASTLELLKAIAAVGQGKKVKLVPKET